MLYIVATPIGNLKEITYRAVEVLQSVELILAEDTRHSAILLQQYGIKAPLLSYQKFNERARCGEIVQRLGAGAEIALISDAGMPLVSDPGSILLRAVIDAGLPYTVVSGPCAAVNAAVLSGLDISSFCMVGFLPEKNIDRSKLLKKFQTLECTLLFYISPHSVMRDLTTLFEALGARQAVLIREISKLHEEEIRFTLGSVPEFTCKGEFVLAVEGAPAPEEALCSLSVAEHVAKYMEEGLTKREAIKCAAADRGVAKSEIYAIVMKND